MLNLKISPKNSKLGAIPSFSLPSVLSCPAHTNYCSSICYAYKIEKLYPNVKKAYDLNFSLIGDPDFVPSMIEQIKKLANKKKNPIKVFRFAVSGDITSIKYLYDIISIISHFPNILFYAYTRNWALKNWLPHLEQLRNMPNMTLIASLDDEHIKQNLIPPSDWRVSYVGDKSITDINTLLNLNNRIIVCPNQKQHGKILCDGCTYCFNSKFIKTNRSIYFIKH